MSPLVLVTGATDGIGRETALELSRRGADVIVHGRTLEKATTTMRGLERETGRALPEPVAADLSDLAQVRALADALRARGRSLSVVVHNAGVYAKKRLLTDDGRELSMAVNHDAPVLLTHLLLDTLAAARDARIVLVSSIAHTRGSLDLADLDLAHGYDGYSAYAASKLANVLFAVELARRLPAARPGARITANALHPGVVSTKLLRAGFGMGGPDSLAEGAQTSVYLALSDDVKNVSGRYFVRCREAAASRFASDRRLCAAFYEESCRRVGVDPLPAPA